MEICFLWSRVYGLAYQFWTSVKITQCGCIWESLHNHRLKKLREVSDRVEHRPVSRKSGDERCYGVCTRMCVWLINDRDIFVILEGRANNASTFNCLVVF